MNMKEGSYIYYKKRLGKLQPNEASGIAVEVILDSNIDVAELSKSFAIISGISSDTRKTSCLMTAESGKEILSLSQRLYRENIIH